LRFEGESAGRETIVRTNEFITGCQEINHCSQQQIKSSQPVIVSCSDWEDFIPFSPQISTVGSFPRSGFQQAQKGFKILHQKTVFCRVIAAC
jgi:hypothetical protein